MNRQGIIYTVIFTFVASFFFVALLSLTNEFTRTKVDRNQVVVKRRAVLNAFGIETMGTDEDYTLYESRIKEREIEGYRIYDAQLTGEKAAAIEFSGSALWGTITGVLAVKEDLSRIIGMDIISQNETPGLGGRIDEAWFKEQFRNELIKNDQILVTGSGGGDKNKDNGKVDAITGASRTSQAVEQVVNQYLAILRKILGAK